MKSCGGKLSMTPGFDSFFWFGGPPQEHDDGQATAPLQTFPSPHLCAAGKRCVVYIPQTPASHVICGMVPQGRKAPGRLEAIAGICAAAESALNLLGLQHGAPDVLLAELRALALVRYPASPLP